MVSDKIGTLILYGIRHAEVAEDKEGTIRGLLNPKLDAKGRRDAESLVKWFKDIPLSFIATDDMERTKQTAWPLAKSKNLMPIIDPELRSWDVGSELEGEDIEKNKAVIARLKMHPQLVPVGGQSWGNYGGQVDESLNHYAGMALDKNAAGAIGIHGSYIQIVAEMLGFNTGDTAYDHTPVDPAGVIGFYMKRDGLLMKVLKGGKESTDE